MRSLVLLGLMASSAFGDVYMHNPRGSNDRCGEGNDNRNNANRLFDSQNNAAGGYGVAPPMKFYEGSWLTVEWTAQHACGNDNAHCQFVLQYNCGTKDAPKEKLMRDGTDTDRIPENDDAGEGNAHEEEAGVYKYGMHEPYMYYAECKMRKRNGGLFLADQQLNSNDPTAIYTRQDNDGSRYGFECPEERDYYPYWHPSPWKDIAVFTTDTTMCEYYQQESQNVKNKGHCSFKKGEDESENKEKMMEMWKHNNQDECKTNGGIWTEDMAFGVAPPDCLKAPWSRDNHLGNGITDTLAGHMVHYNWSIPTESQEPCIGSDNCICVLRLRYNISTADYEGRPMYPEFADVRMSAVDEEDEEKVESPVTQDPYVKVASNKLALALNPDQYGRVFQDRTHVFEIQSRPDWMPAGARIFNLNVRGKRGNIVQTYPAVEYDFVPTNLVVRHFDWVHFQWTGFDDNPHNGNNNAEGTDGTDRSNLVQIESLNHNIPMDDSEKAIEESGMTRLFSEVANRNRMAYLDQSGCATENELAQNNDDDDEADQDEKNCMKLNAALPYFDGGLVRMNNSGTFYYMSTRNNNFSNRSQKGSLTVLPVLRTWAVAVTVVGAVLCLGALGVGYTIHKNPMGSTAEMFNRM